MKRRLAFLVAAFLAACASPPPTSREPDSPELAGARDEVSELTAIARDDVVPLGRSPTSLFASLLERDPRIVRRVFEDAAQAAARSSDGTESAVRETAAFAYARGKESSGGFGWTTSHGAVEWKARMASYEWGANSRESLDKLIGRTMEAPPRVDVDLVLRAYDKREFEWNYAAPALALGEVCAVDDAEFRTLLSRAQACPDWFCATALAASRRPQAVPPLVAAVRRELSTPRDDWDVRIEMMRPFVRSLAFASRRDFEILLSSLAEKDLDDALVALVGPESFERFLDKLDASPDEKTRRARFARLCRFAPLSYSSPGPQARRLFERLLAGVDSGDADQKKRALAATDLLLYPGNHYAVSQPRIIRPGEPPILVEGGRDGSYAGPEKTLRMVVADLEAGRLEFVESRPSLWTPRPTEFDWRRKLPGDPEKYGNEPPLPLRVTGRWTPDGLALSVMNIGDAAVAFDPVGARYGAVEFTRERRENQQKWTEVLRLELGFFNTYVVVPARLVETIAPGASYEWTIPVRPEHRGATIVVVSLWDHVAVVGDCDAPLVRFSDALVMK